MDRFALPSNEVTQFSLNAESTLNSRESPLAFFALISMAVYSKNPRFILKLFL